MRQRPSGPVAEEHAETMKDKVLLSLMMFLQYMVLPVWFVPLVPYVQALPDGGAWVLWCGFLMAFGTFTSPAIGMVADRFLNAERVLSICYLANAVLLGAAFFVRSPAVLFVLLLLTMLVYMPTWSLTATIGMAHLDKVGFSRIRVFGTVGWVASGVFSLVGARLFGVSNFDSTPWIFAAGACGSSVAAVLSLVLPPTRPTARGVPMSIADAFGFKAFVLFRRPQFRRFAVFLLLAMLPFQWYNVYCAAYLKESGFEYLTLTVNLGQVGEIAFMLLVPLILARFGFRHAMLIALSALVFRNGSFLLASACGLAAFDFGGILVHGLIFGIFIVGSQMRVCELAPPELRGQAQGLVNIITAGVGVFGSNAVFNAVLGSAVPHRWPQAYAVAIVLSLAVIAAILLVPSRRD